MELGQPIAIGRTAEVYAWGKNEVIKLFRPDFHESEAEYEANLSRATNDLDLPTPAVIDVVKVNGRPGIVFERVTGPTMLQDLMDFPDKTESYARMLAELQASMHDQTVEALPDLKQRLQQKIQRAKPLPEAWRTAVLAHLDSLPEDGVTCHGDFHPDNIILSAGGPVVIDWIDVTCGHWLADIARTIWLLNGSALPPDMPEATRRSLESIRQTFTETFLVRYREFRPIYPDDLARWLLPVMAARLDEGIVEEKEVLLAAVKKGLQIQ